MDKVRQKPSLPVLGPNRAPANTLFTTGWFPESEFAEALERWPSLKENWGTDTYREYCRTIQGHLLNFLASGMKLDLTPIRIKPFLRWCETNGEDPGSASARSAYAAHVRFQGKSIPWPPRRNDRCWCGSGKKYKDCCATAPRAPFADEVAE